jgi:thiol-disulfide isomerase/thioredoxin
MATLQPPAMLPLGTEAPDFSLPDPDGTMWTRDQLAGPHGLLVAFVCNHCPYVRHVAPTLATAAARWKDAGVGVVGINSNDATRYPEDAPDRMAEHARDWGWDFPYVVDGEQAAALAYRAACTPDFFLFDDERRLVYRGRLDGATPGNDVPVTGDELDAAVSAMLSGAAVSTDQRPSVGCSIKWKPGNEPGW